MPGDQLFEDYDPDMEDVFGHKNPMTAKRVTVTDQQKADPLRKPKVELQGILVAEKQPVTARDIERRMMDEYGQSLDPKKYGCNTLDDLLQACSDTIVHQKRRDGVHVYMAKVSEANQDIVEMVQLQVSGHERKRAPRSFLSSGSYKGYGTHGASFRPFKGTRAAEMPEPIKARGTSDQVKARNKLGPAKTIARLQNLADLLKECRESIGIPHPNEHNRKVVTLGALAEKFKQIYGLPAWGKNMTESELHKHISVSEFSGVLSFWQLRDDGDIFVEDYLPDRDHKYAAEKDQNINLPLVDSQHAEIIPTPSIPEEQNEEVALASSLNHSNVTRPISSVLDRSIDKFSSIDGISRDSSMLITEAENDGFFESGPGFGGGTSRPHPSHSSLTGTTRATGATGAAGTSENIAQRFGNVSDGSAVQPSSQPSRAGSSVSQSDSRQGSIRVRDLTRALASSVQPMRPVHSALGSRSIIPQNPLKLLADYIKSRGSIKFDSLPEDDQVMVNFNKDIFKVYAEQPGDMLVRLVDQSVDTSKLVLSNNNLREPVEADFRWMSDASTHIKRGRRHLIKPVMFVAPRGLLAVISNHEEEDLDSDKMSVMEDLLRGAMEGTIQEITRKRVRPGMPAVYIYRQGAEVRYYRVLIVGQAHQEGDVMVLLADHNEQYLADVQFSHLFELPEKTSFRHYAPNVIFATLYGVMAMSLEEQHNLWKNIDDEERKAFIVGYIPEDATKVLSMDMVWRDESGQFEWLSQILKRRGAVLSSDTNSPHLGREPQNAVNSFEQGCYMDFVDYAFCSSPAPLIQQEASKPAEVVDSTNQTVCSVHNPRSLDMYALFDNFIAEPNIVAVVGMFQFVRNVKDTINENSEWKKLVDYMSDVGIRNNIRL